jgi:hypothetical protein
VNGPRLDVVHRRIQHAAHRVRHDCQCVSPWDRGHNH